MPVIILLLLSAAVSLAASETPTFYKDVFPVLQKTCQGCHRPGEAAPMSFLTYESTRPWAAAIREAVKTKKMPPWSADGIHGQFSNDPTLSSEESRTLVSWAEGKAPAGDPKDAPKPLEFVEGWNIGKPDLVVGMSRPYEVPAEGTIEYTRFIIPLNFAEDRWVSAAEVRPGNRTVVHHVIAYLRPPGSKWLAGAATGEPVPKRLPGKKVDDEGGRGWLAGYAPGVPAVTQEPGRAILIKAGSDLVLEMHYTTNGKSAPDQTKVGVIFAKTPPKERLAIMAAMNNKFVIPPNADNYEVKSSYTLPSEISLIGLIPHMHVRGKDFEYVAKYPNGESEILLKVPHYDFNWQHRYKLMSAKVLPAGTVIECTAHFDNSMNNKNNPDATAEVRWGDQSWEEMMIGFMDIVFDPKKSDSEVFGKPKTASVAKPPAE